MRAAQEYHTELDEPDEHWQLWPSPHLPNSRPRLFFEGFEKTLEEQQGVVLWLKSGLDPADPRRPLPPIQLPLHDAELPVAEPAVEPYFRPADQPAVHDHSRRK